MNIEFDHVGIVVTDLEHAIDALRTQNWQIGNIDVFPAEGTKEVYIGPPAATGLLLLIEPIGPGPYQDALNRRGGGLHHIAINVDDVMAFTMQISGSGWYLHLQSLRTLEQHNTIWLARPGVPTLVEVVRRKSLSQTQKPAFIQQIELPLPDAKPLLAKAIGLGSITGSSERDVYVTIGEERRPLADWIKLG